MTKNCCPRSGLIVDKDLFAEKGGRQLTSIRWKERERERKRTRERERERERVREQREKEKREREEGRETEKGFRNT